MIRQQTCPGWGGLVTVLLATIWVPGAPHAASWGADGHRIVCSIAWQRMAPSGRALVTELLGTEAENAFPDSCSWADVVRGTTHRHTAPYHYVNISAGESGFDMSRDCGDEERRCVTWAVIHFAMVLQDRSRTIEVRVEALKFLGHFVGDLHQPLHAGRREDRGGNDVRVRFLPGSRCASGTVSLHRLWDSVVLCHGGFTSPDSTEALFTEIDEDQAGDWAILDIEKWTDESFRLVEEHVYDWESPSAISTGYYDTAAMISRLQLQRAGVRLAALVDAAASGSLNWLD